MNRKLEIFKNVLAVFGATVLVLGSVSFALLYWGMVELDHGVSGRDYGEIILGENIWNWIHGR